MAERDSKSGMSKQSTEKDTGLHCPVCKSRFERQHPEECVVLLAECNYMVDMRNSYKDFLRNVNALLNGNGGHIYCHFQPCQMEEFFMKMQDRLTSLLPEDKLFYDVYNTYPLDQDHVIFEVKSGFPQVSTIDFKTKISTETGVTNPTVAQMRRLLSTDFDPPDCYRPEFCFSDFKEGLAIPGFYENGCIEAKYVRDLPKSTSKFNRLDQMLNEYQLPSYISAFSKLSRGGSIFLGIYEKRVRCEKRETTEFVCRGLRVTESERQYLKATIPLKLKHEMGWMRFADDTHTESKPAMPVEIFFHDVATDEGSDLCVVEIKVNYFHGICFTQVDGPEAYHFSGAHCIANIERLSVKDWLDAYDSRPVNDIILKAWAADTCSVDSGIVSSSLGDLDSGIVSNRLDDFLEFESYICQECGKREHGIQVKPLTAGELFTSNPIFSTYWQFSAKFTRNGGLLEPEDSDVKLRVPEEAVDIPSDIPTYDQSDATERIFSDTESPVDHKSQVVPDIAEAVEIKMAVSTDLERAKEDLKLAETEQIVSPVAEFYAGKDFIFAKQVCISLPHFLPVGFDENQVKVYHVHRDASGRLLVQTIPKGTADSTGDSEDFYMFGEQEIQVMTSHFSGVLCSYCIQHETPPHLKLRLYGKQTKRKRMEVDLKLLVWDKKLSIRDFRKLALLDAKEESTLTSERDLNPVLDASRVELGVQLDMRQEDTDEWEHKFSNSKFPNTRREELTSLLACGRAAVGSTNQGPIVIDWAFQHRDQSDRSDDKWFSCTIDVGYVKEEEEGSDDNAVSALQFLPKPKKLTLPVNDLKQSDTAQHSAHGSGRSTPIPTMVFHNVKNVGIASSHNVSHSNPEDTELTERKTLDSSPVSASNEQSLDAQLSGMELTEGAAENPDRRAPAGTREFRIPTQVTQSKQPTHSNESEENA